MPTTAPAVILMAFNMPRLDGLRTTRRLNENPRTRSIPVILFTSDPLEGQATDAGCASFLRNPCSRQELFAAVRAELA